MIHGGAFMMGDKTMGAAEAATLVEAGYAVASLDYRLSGEAPALCRCARGAHAARSNRPRRAALACRATRGREAVGVSWFAPIDFLTMDDQHRANEHCRSVFRPHDDAGSPSRAGWAPRSGPSRTGCGRRARSPTSSRAARSRRSSWSTATGTARCPASRPASSPPRSTAAGADVTHHVVEGAGHARRFPAAERMPGVVRFLDRVLRA